MAAPTAPNISSTMQWDKTSIQAKMPRKKTNPLLLIAAVLIAILCISGMWRASHQAAPQETVKVVGAAKDVPAGTTLSYTSLRYIPFPRQFMTKDMSTSLNEVAGHMTKSFIPQGEPVRAGMVFANKNGLAYTLETHERAITLQLSDEAMVDHELLSDDRVDILVVSTKDAGKFTKTIAQDVRVLLAAPKEQSLSRQGSSNSNKITLAVTGATAEALSEAAEVGKIRLILRNRLSHTQQSFAGTEPDDLLPPSAFRLSKVSNIAPLQPKGTVPPPAFSLPSFGALMPPPPLVNDAEPSAVASVPSPVEWIVEMFHGSKKETCAVPSK